MKTKFDRPKEAKVYALIVKCPTCKSAPLKFCKSLLTLKKTTPHCARMEAAENHDEFCRWKSHLRKMRAARIDFLKI